jgi:hypothetical protein
MSTDLYGLRILELAPLERRVRLRVFVVYYDSAYEQYQELTDDPSFFLRALRDLPIGTDESAAPICKAVDLDDFLSEPWVAANAWRFIERVERLETRNEPIDWSQGYNDFYYEHDGQWPDEEKLVQADFDVWVRSSAWIEHLSPGLSWGSTIYWTSDALADRIPPGEASSLPNLHECRSIDLFEGGQRPSAIGSLLFSRDGKLLAVANQGSDVVVIDVETLKQRGRWTLESTGPELFAFEDGKLTALAFADEYVIDVAQGTLEKRAGDEARFVQLVDAPKLRSSPCGRFKILLNTNEVMVCRADSEDILVKRVTERYPTDAKWSTSGLVAIGFEGRTIHEGHVELCGMHKALS